MGYNKKTVNIHLAELQVFLKNNVKRLKTDNSDIFPLRIKEHFGDRSMKLKVLAFTDGVLYPYGRRMDLKVFIINRVRLTKLISQVADMMNPFRWGKIFKRKIEPIVTLEINLKGDLNNIDYKFILYSKKDTKLLGQVLRKELIKVFDFITASNIKIATY